MLSSVVDWQKSVCSAAPFWDRLGLSEQQNRDGRWPSRLSCSSVPFFCTAEQTLHFTCDVFSCVCVCCRGRRKAVLSKTPCLFIIRGETKLRNYEAISVRANWWFVPLFHFRQVWKDPLEISIKPNKITHPQRYCALSVEWTTFYVCHNVLSHRESPPFSGCGDILTVTTLSPIPSNGWKYTFQLTRGAGWFLTRSNMSPVNLL